MWFYRIYWTDRDGNNFVSVSRKGFPNKKDCSDHLQKTLNDVLIEFYALGMVAITKKDFVFVYPEKPEGKEH